MCQFPELGPSGTECIWNESGTARHQWGSARPAIHKHPLPQDPHHFIVIHVSHWSTALQGPAPCLTEDIVSDDPPWTVTLASKRIWDPELTFSEVRRGGEGEKRMNGKLHNLENGDILPHTFCSVGASVFVPHCLLLDEIRAAPVLFINLRPSSGWKLAEMYSIYPLLRVCGASGVQSWVYNMAVPPCCMCKIKISQCLGCQSINTNNLFQSQNWRKFLLDLGLIPGLKTTLYLGLGVNLSL